MSSGGNVTIEDASELADFLDSFCYTADNVPQFNADGTPLLDANGNQVTATQQITGPCAYAQFLADQNAFSWTQHLLVPGLQALANIAILEWQRDQYDDIEEDRLNHIDNAVRHLCECMNCIIGDLRDAVDEVPQPAMYQPVNIAGEQLRMLEDGIDMIPISAEYAKLVNDQRQMFEEARAAANNPKHLIMTEATWCSISDLIEGKIPIGETVATLTRSAEQTFNNGRLGRGCGTYTRNLGILDYRLQKAARAEQREERASINRDVSPISEIVDLREFMLKPDQRLGVAMQMSQLIQNSLQNAYNACARKPPHLLQEIQMRLQKCQLQMQLLAGKAGLVSDFVPNISAVLNNQVRDITNGIGLGLGGISFNGQSSGGGIGGIGGINPLNPFGGSGFTGGGIIPVSGTK